MNKPKTNYWVDVIIAIAFILSAVSGIVFLFPLNGSSVLGISYRVWDQIHTWGSLLMIAGVLAHLALHWKWIVAMTKKTFFPPAKPRTASVALASGGSDLSRRQFLRTAGLGVIATGAAMVGFKTLIGSLEADADQLEANKDVDAVLPSAMSIPLQVIPSQSGGSAPSSSAFPTQAAPAMPTAVPTAEPVQPAAPAQTGPRQRFAAPSQSPQGTYVACPKGLSYDPYPGRCRHYVDYDGDGYCDYSIPMSA